MSPRAVFRSLLVLAGPYDGALGLAFLAAAPAMFKLTGIPAPSHWGYVHFAAAVLLIFALMFFAAVVYPAGNRNLIAYGMLLKLAYCGVVLYHWLHGGVPWIFILFFFVDAVWFVVLGWIFIALGRATASPVPATPTAP